MTTETDASSALTKLIEERVILEESLRAEPALSEERIAEYDLRYAGLQRALGDLFIRTEEQSERIQIMLELVRILENKLVYLQNFVVEPTAQGHALASIVHRFLDELRTEGNAVLTNLESVYFRATVSLYAGDRDLARQLFQQACESEEPDDANDIKYKSFVILGNLMHEDRDYAKAAEIHEQSIRFSPHDNVRAQALALRALNAYALQQVDEALDLFSQALVLFDSGQPYFNGYFHRNTLLFCGLIHFERREYAEAERFYRQVLDEVEPASWDHFDALSQLGKICYLTHRNPEAVDHLRRAVVEHRVSENESLVDAWYWLARACMLEENRDEARRYLQRVVDSEVAYERKAHARELLDTVV